MNKWLKSGKYLPAFMRDFHDQKLLFKFLDEMQRNTAKSEADLYFVPWTSAHVYVIDVFLWVMARRGWTLQRSRKMLPFRDIEADLQAFEKELRDQFSQFMKKEKNKDDC